MIVRAPLAAALVAVLVTAAGCGGGSASPEEEWAESICSPLVEWRTEMEEAGDELREALESGGVAGLADTIREAGERASDATEEMLSQLDAVGPPPVDESSDAADVVQGLADSLGETRDTVTEQLEGLEGASVAEATEALALVAAQLSGAVTQVQTTLETLGAVGGEIEDAFADADSCRELERERDQG